MAHVQTEHVGLWKPQDLNLDKISSQKMFIDNINILDNKLFKTDNKLAVINTRLANIEKIPVSIPMYDQGDTRYQMGVQELGGLLLLYESNGSNGEFNVRLPDVSSIDVGKRVMIHSVNCDHCTIIAYPGTMTGGEQSIYIGAGNTVTMILVKYSNKSPTWLAIK